MHAAVRAHVSFAEYLAMERDAPAKHEYLDGIVYAMSGGSPEHSLLAANLIYELKLALGDRPCAVFTSDLRVRVRATGLSTYPSVSVVCGPLARVGDDPHAIENPTVLIEVLSKSSEAYDRGEKFAHYRRLDSLREYVLIAQDAPRIEVFARGADGLWVLREAHVGERIALSALGVELAVDAVYRGVELARLGADAS